MTRKTISKSKLKAKALEYFREVEQTGLEIVITDRGRPVLKLVPYHRDFDSPVSSLRETVVRYDDPTLPVAAEDWEVDADDCKVAADDCKVASDDLEVRE